MAEDRPDRHPDPDPTAVENPSTPSGGTDGSAPDTARTSAPEPAGTAGQDAAGSGGAGHAPAAGARTAAADGPATPDAPAQSDSDDDDDAPTEKSRPAAWRGAAAVPPPGPKKRRRFGLGRDDDAPAPDPTPEKPLDPTLDLPAPVDPWEGSTSWEEHQAGQEHYDYPAPPLHPTRIDRPDMPRTTIDRPAATPPGPPPSRRQQPPQPPRAPQPPPRSHTPQAPPPQPPRSQAPPPRYAPPPQYAPPPSYARPQQPPPPPPAAQSRPAPPSAPVVPPKKKEKRKKDRRPAARPQLPPGYPPPGYPPPTAARRPRRRRRRWPMVLLTMLLLTVACCCGVPAYFGTPLWQQYPAKASMAAEISDLSLRSGQEADETTRTLEAEMRGEHLLAESTFAGVYGDDAGKRVTVYGMTGFRWSPETDLEGEMTRLTEQYGLSGVEPVDVGEVGGFQRCGTGQADGGTVVVCGWADHGSLGTVVLTRRSVQDSAALTTRIRQSVIIREQISISV
ncbi:hypothetical protein [Catenuloplanes japonicus]|uniref:hypothetical protein n=1 Tax=Catenuloplanes japonicus TaxID=33876 RepID=UPI000A712DFE|nr:hypothetical protein [Catenuloplanes japonicus]